jgi:hypothetical protein
MQHVVTEDLLVVLVCFFQSGMPLVVIIFVEGISPKIFAGFYRIHPKCYEMARVVPGRLNHQHIIATSWRPPFGVSEKTIHQIRRVIPKVESTSMLSLL